jgi:hypothetical protein
MPIDALSLLGFLSQSAAIRHLQKDCVLATPTPSLCEQEWQVARAALASPYHGQPEILDLPRHALTHISQNVEPLALKLGLYKDADLSPPRYCLIETAPLLAHQLVIRLPNAAAITADLPAAPTLMDMLPICLPGRIPAEPFEVLRQPNALVIKARSLNLHFDQPLIGENAATLCIRPAPPFVTVIARGERFHLWDGYHRAYALARLGATHIPCMLRQSLRDDLIDPALECYFPASLLQSADPPTLGHFSRRLAHPVRLKSMSRVLHVSWAEWMLAEDDEPSGCQLERDGLRSNGFADQQH